MSKKSNRKNIKDYLTLKRLIIILLNFIIVFLIVGFNFDINGLGDIVGLFSGCATLTLYTSIFFLIMDYYAEKKLKKISKILFIIICILNFLTLLLLFLVNNPMTISIIISFIFSITILNTACLFVFISSKQKLSIWHIIVIVLYLLIIISSLISSVSYQLEDESKNIKCLTLCENNNYKVRFNKCICSDGNKYNLKEKDK